MFPAWPLQAIRGHMRITGHAYTADELAFIEKAWLTDGYSASQIARHLGQGLSRNAIVGLVHRRGWVKTAADVSHARKAARAAHVRQAPPPRVRPKRLDREEAWIVVAGMEPLGPVMDFPPAGHCRYIATDVLHTQWQCCARPSVRDDSPWCKDHLAIVTRDPNEYKMNRPDDGRSRKLVTQLDGPISVMEQDTGT